MVRNDNNCISESKEEEEEEGPMDTVDLTKQQQQQQQSNDNDSKPLSHHGNNNDNDAAETLDIEAMAAAITAAVQSSGRGTSSMALGNASIIPNRARSQSESTRTPARNNVNNKLPPRVIPQDAMAPRPKRSSSMSSQHSLPPSFTSSSSSSTSTRTRSSSSASSSSRHYSARFSWLVGHSQNNSNSNSNTIDTQRQQQETIVEESSEDPSVDDGRNELLYRGIRVKEMKTTLKTMVIPHEVENPMPKVELQRPGFARINY
ncbi:hypothetical protein BDB00DRAFT_875421 [Zychaea mexicana]|uniref:uncharacterized protein n=1 Tax=Zychaea mexicana TaxID=64656 RepID=UPI0022FEB3AA|nr:uncharacterized protein BDB00DRAFT_875421 [Zychaea mexicana]KAI9490372.1 hypothetical protein BDB00DRAFT_875421 [Zychaea mexicana]